MDVREALKQLYAEKERLENVIASLESLLRDEEGGTSPPVATSRRGRKSMGAEERQQVSERMKKYWAKRRKT